METKIRRPAAVWIAQSMMIIVSVMLLLPITLLLFGFLPQTSEAWIVAIYLGMLAYFLFIICLFLTVFWGLARRRQWGRWLGVVLLSVVVLYGIFPLIRQVTELWHLYKFGIAFEYLAGTAFLLMLCCLLIGLNIWVIVSLAIDNRIIAFFSSKT